MPYELLMYAWILEATREIRTAKEIGIDLINFHANFNGMFYGENRRILLDNLIRSLREIIKYAEKSDVKVMLENIPLSNGIHKVNEIKYIIDNVPSLFVHLDVAHAFTSGGMESVTEYINTFRDKIIHIHWHDNHGSRDEHLPIGEGLIDHRCASWQRAIGGIDRDGLAVEIGVPGWVVDLAEDNQSGGR